MDHLKGKGGVSTWLDTFCALGCEPPGPQMFSIPQLYLCDSFHTGTADYRKTDSSFTSERKKRKPLIVLETRPV